MKARDRYGCHRDFDELGAFGQPVTCTNRSGAPPPTPTDENGKMRIAGASAMSASDLGRPFNQTGRQARSSGIVVEARKNMAPEHGANRLSNRLDDICGIRWLIRVYRGGMPAYAYSHGSVGQSHRRSVVLPIGAQLRRKATNARALSFSRGGYASCRYLG